MIAGARSLGVLVLAGALLAGCGSSAAESPSASPTTPLATPSPTPAVEKIGLADACPRVQGALDARLSGDNEQWKELGADLSALADEADDAASTLIRQVALASTVLEDSSNFLDDQGAWLDLMDKLTKECKAAGSPLD